MKHVRILSIKQTILIIGGYIILVLIIGYGLDSYFLYQREPEFKLISEYKKVLKEDPNNSQAYAKLGDLYYDLAVNYPEKDFLENAKDKYKKAVKLYPENVGYKYNLAMIYELLKDNENKRNQLLEIIHLEPEHVLANYDLGSMYKIEKDYQKAIFHFEKCLEFEPGAANVYFELGEIYEALKNGKMAVQMYKMVQKYDPNHQGINQKLIKLK